MSQVFDSTCFVNVNELCVCTVGRDKLCSNLIKVFIYPMSFNKKVTSVFEISCLRVLLGFVACVRQSSICCSLHHIYSTTVARTTHLLWRFTQLKKCFKLML